MQQYCSALGCFLMVYAVCCGPQMHAALCHLPLSFFSVERERSVSLRGAFVTYLLDVSVLWVR